jgi:hypothetical protein
MASVRTDAKFRWTNLAKKLRDCRLSQSLVKFAERQIERACRMKKSVAVVIPCYRVRLHVLPYMALYRFLQEVRKPDSGNSQELEHIGYAKLP